MTTTSIFSLYNLKPMHSGWIMTTLHHTKMDERLFTAALSGDSSALFELLREDPLILHTVLLVTSNTPLHIASLLGHKEFARVTMQRNPRLSRVLNQQGLSPIHIASLTGDVEIVRELLNTDIELFALKDKDGRTPLHCAVIKGSLEVLSELLSRHPESARELTPSNETVLHLAVKNNQCQTFASLLLILRRLELADELLNCRDEEGNTVLHLATARKQYQTLKILLRDKKVDVNAVNSNGLTALDLLVTCPLESDDMVISEMLQRAGGERASTSPRPRRRPPSPQPPQLAVPSHESPAGEEGTSRSRHSDISNSERVVDSVKNGIIALAALFATVTFEVALNPPGGVWQGWDAIDDAKVIEAAMKANITNLAFLETARSFSKIWPLSKLLGGPINKLNLTDPGLRGPAKAMSVTLSGEDFIKFLYSDAVCFMGSLAIIFTVMFISSFRRYRSTAVIVLMIIVLGSASSVYLCGIALITNEQFGEWVIRVGVTNLIWAGVAFLSIVLWNELKMALVILRMGEVIVRMGIVSGKMVKDGLCHLYHWLFG